MVDSTRKTTKFSFRPRPAVVERIITHRTPMRGVIQLGDIENLNDLKELRRLMTGKDEKLGNALVRQITEEILERPVEKRAMALRKRREEEIVRPTEQADEVQRKRRREEETEKPVAKKRVMALRKRRREVETECPAEQADKVQRKRRREEETEKPVAKKRVIALRKRRREEEKECPAEQADEVQRKRRREEETEKPVAKKRVMALRKRRREAETERPVEKKRVMALRKRRREEETECPAEQADEVQRKRKREEETVRPVESRAKAQRRGEEEEAEKRVKAPRKRRREEKTESPVKKRRKFPGKREEEPESPAVKRGKALVKRKKKAESPTKKRHKASGKREEGTESLVDKILQNDADAEKIKMLMQKITEKGKVSHKEAEITKQKEERMEKESRVPGCLYPESFIFHKILGSGCNGQVMLATHCDSGKLVAIKIVQKLGLTFKDRDTIMNERQVMQMVIGNQYCSKLYATFQTEDHLYYVMEFCSGGELRKQMKPKKLCDLPTMRRLASELLCGLQFMHSKGILHGDVNPENILLDCKGHVRLADFGNAVTNMFGSKTITGQFGTIGYMAPEIFKKQPFDKAVDYFALGVILFEAAFGIYPFDTYPQASICHESPRYPVGADDVLVDFLNKLLCKDQKKRKAYVAKIRNHRFFRGIDWEQLEAGKTRAPFSACRKDLKEEMTKTTILLTQTTLNVYKSLKYTGGKFSRKTQERFKGFTFVSDEWKAIQNLKTKNTKS